MGFSSDRRKIDELVGASIITDKINDHFFYYLDCEKCKGFFIATKPTKLHESFSEVAVLHHRLPLCREGDPVDGQPGG